MNPSHRYPFIAPWALGLAAIGLVACGSEDGTGDPSGAAASTSHAGTDSGTGGVSAGGSSMGGNSMGGTSLGGTSAGGTPAGGTTSGGAGSGGTPTGGGGTGGTSAGGSSGGGTSSGGANLGGSTTGGTATGGAASGGTGDGGAIVSGGSAGMGTDGGSAGIMAAGGDAGTGNASAGGDGGHTGTGGATASGGDTGAGGNDGSGGSGGFVPTTGDPRTLGYLGCSMSVNVAEGYQMLNGERLWPPIGQYNGMVVQNWASMNDGVWDAFENAMQQHGQPEDVWVMLCIFNNQVTLDEARQIVANVRSRAPNATIYITGQPLYDNPNSCFLAGDGGPDLTDRIAREAAADPSLGVIYPGALGPLGPDQNSDGCHANDSGRLELGQQMIDWFGM